MLQAHNIEYLPVDELANVLLTCDGLSADACVALSDRIIREQYSVDDLERAENMLDSVGLLEHYESGATEAPEWIDLDQFLASEYWNDWDAENRAHLAFKNPERCQRNDEAAECGTDGSTHGERIDDMRRAVRDYYLDHYICERNREQLDAEIDAAERWHIRAGTIDESGA